MNKRARTLMALLGLFIIAIPIVVVWADGDETLGPPSIEIAPGSGIVAAGVGLFGSQPGTIDIDVPLVATVEQVLIYWEGQSDSPTPQPEVIQVNGIDVTGTLIGTSAFPGFPNVEQISFRADITGLGLVGPGSNSIQVDGLDFDLGGGPHDENNGFGVLVIFDDGFGTGVIEIRDGHDHGYLETSVADPGYKVTVVQTFNFAAADVDRSADLVSFVADVELLGSGAPRPNALVYTVGGVTTALENPFFQSDGPEWDTLTVPVTIPAGATTLEVEVLSGFSDGSGDRPESVQWVAAALAIEPSLPALARITGGGWRVKGSGGESIRVSNGLTLHCDITLSNNLQINWDKGQKWHIDKLVDAAFCEDNPDFTPEPPEAPVDTYIGIDVGKLGNVDGSVACFILEDHGEVAGDPDGPDQALIRIWDVGFDPGITEADLSGPDPCKVAAPPDPTTDPNTVLFVPLSDVQGNLQFHFDQPHRNKK